MAKAATPKTDASEDTGAKKAANLVSISSKYPRRRAGMQFGPEAKVVDLALLTEAEIAALKTDPFLIVKAV